MRSPFRAVLTAQARYLAPVVALATIATALLPLLALQGEPAERYYHMGQVQWLLARAAFFAPFYPATAVALGILFATGNWLPDATGRWVYAFTLPVSRPHLALLRLGAGAILLLPATLVLWGMGAIGVATAELPAVVQAHPGTIALRFAAGTLVVYAFASLLVLLGRKVWYLAAAVVLLLILGGLGIDWFAPLMDTLFLQTASPFHVFAGSWLLLDV